MPDSAEKKLYISDIGLTNFQQAWDFQKRLVLARSQGKLPDCLIITEHNPVITMGRGTNSRNLLVSREELQKRNISLYSIERGGDVTLHSPGQVVAYPIIDLAARGKDLHKYLRDLERVMIQTLAEFGMKASIRKGLTGVWADNHKVGAIGVAVSQWISYHGLVLNINNDLELFKLINPCGITRFPTGSISSLTKKKYDKNKVAKTLTGKFSEIFGYDASMIATIPDLWQEFAPAGMSKELNL